MAGLSPIPFSRLVARAFEELERNGSIFDLPERRFVLSSGVDSSVLIHGRRAAAPLGPSAGPHTQMAQNIVLAWLAGARFFELKTVQTLDQLDIPRPCIDARNVGYNIEWSQELRLGQSLEEYVKAAMLIRMLSASGAVAVAPPFDAHLFDISVGYDLAGIRGEGVTDFLRGMTGAAALIDALRPQIPDKWRRLRDLDFDAAVSRSVTLSTFHGCPVDEIERIADHLMSEHALDCVVKLNPTLLGAPLLREILGERLGYHDVAVPDSAFERDPDWTQAAEILERLRRRAVDLGRSFGVKLTNTLIVENRAGFLPESERFAYLSGAPLHVLAMHLVKRVRDAFGKTLPISFSAGIDRTNYPDAVALGLAPVTVCTDLLRQGGYGRLQGYAQELEKRMTDAGATSIAQYATADIDAYLARLERDPRYSRDRVLREPHRTGRPVSALECSMCDLCIPACPNAAIFPLPSLETSVTRGHQIGVLGDLCNDCGNCEVFCPDGGAPNRSKLRFAGMSGEIESDDALAGWARRSALDPSRVNFINCLPPSGALPEG